MATSVPQRSTTTTLRMVGQSASATSRLGLSGDGAPRRYPASAVMATTAAASLIRSIRESGLNPPNTRLCAAPIRVQASIATTVSGIIGM